MGDRLTYIRCAQSMGQKTPRTSEELQGQRTARVIADHFRYDSHPGCLPFGLSLKYPAVLKGLIVEPARPAQRLECVCGTAHTSTRHVKTRSAFLTPDSNHTLGFPLFQSALLAVLPKHPGDIVHL